MGIEIYVIYLTALLVGLYFLRRYFAGGICYCKDKLDGKTVIVTGATSGIGVETAKDMARRGAKVILAVRNVQRGHKLAKEISRETQNELIYVHHLDLASLNSVKEFAKRMKGQNIDILINNAGTLFNPFTITEDGFELVFQTNYIGAFLLTKLLLNNLIQAAPSRVINLSSIEYKQCKVIHYDTLNSKEGYKSFAAYERSKLAIMLFTRKLAKELKEHKVSVFSAHPGLIDTDIVRNIPLIGLIRVVGYPLGKLVNKTVWQGSQTTIHCAVCKGLEQFTGCYFTDCKMELEQEHARNDAEAEKLWKWSMEMVGKWLKE